MAIAIERPLAAEKQIPEDSRDIRIITVAVTGGFRQHMDDMWGVFWKTHDRIVNYSIPDGDSGYGVLVSKSLRRGTVTLRRDVDEDQIITLPGRYISYDASF